MKKQELINTIERMIENVKVVANAYKNLGDTSKEEYYKGQREGYEIALYMLQDDKFAESMKEIFSK